MSAHDVIMHFPLAPDDRTLDMTPWFHRGGLYSASRTRSSTSARRAVSLRAFDPGRRCSTWSPRAPSPSSIGAPTDLAVLLAEEQGRDPA